MADMEMEDGGATPRRSFNLLNVFSGLLLVLTLLTCLCSGLIYMSPTLPFNPFPPPTITNTPGPTDTPTITPRPPTRTPLPTATRVQPPTETPAPVASFDAVITLAKQYLAGRGCQDISFAGEVRDVNSKGLAGYVIQLTSGSAFQRTSTSGSVTDYGDGGWEVILSDQPPHTEYTVRLFDPSGAEVGPQLQPQITSTNCDESLTVINFQQKAP
jgi:hypothetical protein